MGIRQTWPQARISGIDVSSLSLQMPQVLKYYTPPIKVCFLQDEVMRIDANFLDHVICFSALHSLNRMDFITTLSRIFIVAQKSVAFHVDDASKEYIDSILECLGKDEAITTTWKPSRVSGPQRGRKGGLMKRSSCSIRHLCI
jgi:hypothetical protein